MDHTDTQADKVLSPKIDLEIESAVFDQRSSLLYLTISQVFSVWFIPFHKAPVRLVTVLHLVPSNQQHQHHSSHNTNGNGNGADHRNNNNTPNHVHHIDGTDEDEPSYAEVASGSAHPSSSPNLNHRSPTSGSSNSSTRGGGGGGPTRYLIKSQEDYYQVNEFLKFVLGVPGACLWSVWQIFSTILCVLGAAIFSPLMNLSGLGAWLASSKSNSTSSRISVSLPSLLSLSGLRGGRDSRSEGRDSDSTDGTPARQKVT